MKRTLASILFMLGLMPFIARAALSPEGFSSEFAEAIHLALPGRTVLVVDSLELKVKSPDGKEFTTFLDNAYREYVRFPSGKKAIIDRYVSSLLASYTDAKKLDPQQIVPVIKDAAWIQDMQIAGGRANNDKKMEQVVEDFNGDLVIVYAEDSETSTKYFSPKVLEEAGIDRKKLRSLAVTNLRRILPQVEAHAGPLVSMLTAGGDYVASLLLIDEIWSGGKLAVDGEIVVAIPSRDVLLYTGSRNTAGVAKLREMARDAVAKGSYTLTDQLFVYRNGKFQRF